jgi:hypothetical protein
MLSLQHSAPPTGPAAHVDSWSPPLVQHMRGRGRWGEACLRTPAESHNTSSRARRGRRHAIWHPSKASVDMPHRRHVPALGRAQELRSQLVATLDVEQAIGRCSSLVQTH